MTPDRLAEWAERQRLLEAARERLAPRWERDPDRAHEILAERARALARPLIPPAWGAATEALTFELGNETYALEARYLRAVFQLHQLAPIPGATPPVFGVSAWRGALLTILDLRQLLGLPTTGLTDMNQVLVLGEARAAFGILADAAVGLVKIPVSAIRPPAEGVAIRREYLRGITPEAIVVLDATKLLQLHG
jgi:purine-binding chemotaxis protein CheW